MAAVAHPYRPNFRRNSPLAASHGMTGFSAADGPIPKHIGIGDSDSDDEPPPAIKFSKVTQALLADEPAPPSPPQQEHRQEIPRYDRSLSSSKAGADTPSRAPGIRVVRRNSPTAANEGKGSTPVRVIQVGNKGSASAKRSVSAADPYYRRLGSRREPTPTRDPAPSLVTPAPERRELRVRTRSNSATSQDGHRPPVSSSRRDSGVLSRQGHDSGAENDVSELARSASQHQPESASRLGYSTLGRTRNISADVAAAPPPGSQRIKRAPIGSGSFLKSGPVRRGFRRRESEEDVDPVDEAQSGHSSGPSATTYTPRDRSASRPDVHRGMSGGISTRAPSVEPVSTHDFAVERDRKPPSRHASPFQTSQRSRPPSRNDNHEPVRSRHPSVEPLHRTQREGSQPAMTRGEGRERRPSVDEERPKPILDQKPSHKPSSFRGPQFRYVAPNIHADPSGDQENMPPPTFKRNREQEHKHLARQQFEVEKPKARQPEETPVPGQQAQEQRKALGSISTNTPHRAAPAPPPKMSVLDAATTTAGASVTKSKKKRSHIVINGKIFTQMGKIGKGGSSDVYCVMAENYKTFALKRVKLDDCDESAVRGYKGEIDLLKKLTDVERVVRLFDWELNEEKQELAVLMEKGDTDLNRLLTLRLNDEHARYDGVFTRYHWREMLECVLAVHDQDIVHSDLKPANFLLVQGRLKLIDFGIANAIDTDHTVNVHRDTHVGTPNYMSPESITDTNAPGPGQAPNPSSSRAPAKKDMRIGKASDVWSLGCILYQMAYGRPPFAHIANQLSRIMAITNPHHTITFPDTGVGGAVIPASLKATLRKCLNRDPERRPGIRQMLGEEDAFLNPERKGTVVMDEELLGQIIGKVVERCRDPKRGVPSAEEVALYPRSFMEKVRGLVEKG